MSAYRDHPGDYLFRATFENAAVGIAHVGLDGAWLRVNRRLCEIVGYPMEELTQITFQDITHPDDLEADLSLLHATMRGERTGYQMEKRYYRKDGRLIWVILTVALQRDDAGNPLFFISVVEEITRRKEYEEQLKLAVDELNHRVRNTLSIVQSLATMAFPDGSEVKDGRESFVRRIDALANAHGLLTTERWIGARIGNVVEMAIRPHDVEDRFTAEGPDLWLPAKPTVGLAMTLNELATHAIKHGALSGPEGRVRVQWTARETESGHQFDLVWTESGGPPVQQPARSGFGMTLIKGLMPSELNGSVELRFDPDGLVCRLVFSTRETPGSPGGN